MSAHDESWSFTPFPGVPALTMGVCIFNTLRRICHEGGGQHHNHGFQKSRNKVLRDWRKNIHLFLASLWPYRSRVHHLNHKLPYTSIMRVY
ncbi:hypothetical protein K440DRAFT_632730 [Wilcoxina mikolae CBS 423.85]|nr:hypothetical protein K440DRAFT_632730 [Wilcoxina mikolae CBS 423.85]